MDGKLLGSQAQDPGDERIKPEDDPLVCQKQEAEEVLREENLVGVLHKTTAHFFPRWHQWLEEIPDRRDPDLIVYKLETLIWSGLLMLMTGRGARKQIGLEMRTEDVVANLRALSGQEDLESAPHGDTVEYSLIRSAFSFYEKLKAKIIQRLIRGRGLERERLLGRWYTVAVDGVHTYSFDHKHCEHCLYRGNGVWIHSKLVASLVTPSGFCLPMATEWIENEGGVYDKQDCELKAFYRLIPKLRQLYPKLLLCLLLDSLFCCQPIFKLLKENRLEGIVVFKEGSMPEVWEWVMRKVPSIRPFQQYRTVKEKQIQKREARNHDRRIMRGTPKYETRSVVTQSDYQWQEKVQHWDQERHFNILACTETTDGKKACHYVWQVTDGIPLNRNTVEEVANHGGRCRWKIENEGFNTQKNGGYQLEHPYSTDKVSMKCWNELLDIAHILRQLIEKGSLICLAAFGSLANLGKRLFEHFCGRVFIKPENQPKIQIRFSGVNTS
jgi:hypothetical protein